MIHFLLGRFLGLFLRGKLAVRFRECILILRVVLCDVCDVNLSRNPLGEHSWLENGGPRIESMYFLLKIGIFQPALGEPVFWEDLPGLSYFNLDLWTIDSQHGLFFASPQATPKEVTWLARCAIQAQAENAQLLLKEVTDLFGIFMLNKTPSN